MMYITSQKVKNILILLDNYTLKIILLIILRVKKKKTTPSFADIIFTNRVSED